MKDPHKILGVARDATKEQIDKAYRKLAHQWHPDRFVDNPEKQQEAKVKFQEINNAYEALTNPSRSPDFGAGGPWKPFNSELDDFFNSMFRGFQRSAQPPQARGSDIAVELELSLLDVLKGGNRQINFERFVLCSACNGVGGEQVACNECGGAGYKEHRAHSNWNVRTVCPKCFGSGNVIKNTCKKCDRGCYSGTTKESFVFNIPLGVKEGMQFNMPGLGNPIANGRSGDLLVAIKIKPHPFFVRDRANIFCTIPVTYSQLVLGTEVEVPTLEGKATLKIPAGTKSDEKFCLKQMGLPLFNPNSSLYKVGDEIVHIELVVPKETSSGFGELVKQLSEFEQKEIKEIDEYLEKMEGYNG